MQCSLVSRIGNRVYVVWELPGSEYWIDRGENPSKPQSCVKQNKTLAVCGFVSSAVICSIFFIYTIILVHNPVQQCWTVWLTPQRRHYEWQCCSDHRNIKNRIVVSYNVRGSENIALLTVYFKELHINRVLNCEFMCANVYHEVWSLRNAGFLRNTSKSIRTRCAFYGDVSRQSLRYS